MHSKWKHEQNEKTILRMEKNICKWSNWQRISLQNVQEAHAAQYQKKKKNLIKKLASDLNRCFSRKDIQMTSRHMKRYSISLIAREMQIKTTLRYHFILIRMVIIIKKSTNNKCQKKSEPSCTIDQNVNGYNYYWRTIWRLLKI